MPTKLNILPVRVPIGRITDSTGQSYDVLMTPEFARLLSDLMVRIGGPTGFSSDELSSLITTEPTGTAALASLQRKVADLSAQLEAASAMNARVAKLERQLEDVIKLVNLAGPAPVDWEHAGKIGFSKASSVKCTTLEATDQVKLNPANKPVDIKPTGAAGLVTIQPAQAGQVDNMELGKTAPQPAHVTTLGATGMATLAAVQATTLYASQLAALAGGMQVTGAASLAAAASAGLMSYEFPVTRTYVGDGTGYSWRLSKRVGGVTTDLLVVADGGGVEVKGAFACNGKTAQGSYALGAAATDAATTQTLANNLRAALIANGIGA